MSEINDFIDPPAPTKQEVVVKLSLSAPSSESGEQEDVLQPRLFHKQKKNLWWKKWMWILWININQPLIC